MNQYIFYKPHSFFNKHEDILQLFFKFVYTFFKICDKILFVGARFLPQAHVLSVAHYIRTANRTLARE